MDKGKRLRSWMELFGTRGHFVNKAVAAGLLVLASTVPVGASGCRGWA